MTVQTFRAKSVEEATHVARLALGEDAIVVATRAVPRVGVMRMFGLKDIEVSAVAAAPAPTPERREASMPAKLFARGVYQESAPGSADREALLKMLRSEVRVQVNALKGTISPRQDEVPPRLLAEIESMRSALENLAPASKKKSRVASLLSGRGIEGASATSLLRAARARGAEATADEEVVEQVRDALADVVKVAPWPLAAEGVKSVVVVVGPSGVGKTTTIAKLAAQARLRDQSVELVGCDVYRVGAVEQLKRIAGLIGAGFSTAQTEQDLARVLAESEADIVMVDTSGQAPAADAPESLLWSSPGALMTALGGRARHVLLCVPASMRARDLQRVSKTFARTSPTALAITKIDETDAPSALVDGPVLSRLPISVLCFGQRIPEDISPATMGAVLDHVVPRSRAAERVAG